jgi:hypothetical protein
VDRRDKLNWIGLGLGLAIGILAVVLVASALRNINPHKFADNITAVIYNFVTIWLLAAWVLGSNSHSIKVFVLRAFNNEKDRFLVNSVRDLLECYGRVEALRPPPRDHRQDHFVTDTDLGAVTSSDARWQQRVLHLLKRSKIIIVDVSSFTPNVDWEHQQIMQSYPHKAITIAHYSADNQLTKDAIRYAEGNALIEFRQRLAFELENKFGLPRKKNRKRFYSIRDGIESASAGWIPSDAISTDGAVNHLIPMLLAISLGGTLTTFLLADLLLTLRNNTNSNPMMANSAGFFLWFIVVGLVLPKDFLSRPEVWGVFRKIGLRSIKSLRMVSLFFLLTVIIVLGMLFSNK